MVSLVVPFVSKPFPLPYWLRALRATEVGLGGPPLPIGHVAAEGVEAERAETIVTPFACIHLAANAVRPRERQT
jgi:hypothetical protein